MSKKAIRCSVVMCDIVKSRAFTNAVVFNKKLNAVVHEVNVIHSNKLISPLTITLGDEFQGLTKSLEDSFLIANTVKLKLSVKGIKARFVIGTVLLDTKLNSKKAWNMTGLGLPEARQILSNKADENEYRFSLPQMKIEQKLLNMVGRSLTQVEAFWTEKQNQYIFELMTKSNLTIKDLAKKYKVAVSTIYAILEAGEYAFYREQFLTMSEVLIQLDIKK